MRTCFQEGPHEWHMLFLFWFWCFPAYSCIAGLQRKPVRCWRQFDHTYWCALLRWRCWGGITGRCVGSQAEQAEGRWRWFSRQIHNLLAAGKVDTRDMVHTSDFHLFPIIIILSLFIFKKYFTGKYQSFKESCEVKKMNILNMKISLKTKKMENISKTINFDNNFFFGYWLLSFLFF